MFVRPLPPSCDYSSAWSSNLAHEVNANRPDRTSIDSPELDPVNFTYVGPYSFSASYNPGDVVFVDPNTKYWDEAKQLIPVCSGSSSEGLPPICAGLFVATQFVPPYGYDQTYLTGSLAPIYNQAGQTIISDFANTFRWYDYNCLWPIYPLIPTGSLTTVTQSIGGSNCLITANQNYWAPLSPMILLHMCDANGNLTSTYINGVISGSVFNMEQIPY
jgi:hypothetical protein